MDGFVLLNWVMWLAPAVVPIAAMILAFVLWLRLLAVSAWLRKVGEERLALYAEVAIAQFGWVGAIVVSQWVDEKISGDPFDDFLVGIWFLSETSGTILVLGAVALYALNIAIAVASGWVSDYFGEKPTPFATLIRPRTVGERFAWVTVVSPSAGFTEEFLFRGVLLSVLLELSGDPVIAVALSSLLFGLGHAPYGLVWTIGTTVFGVVSAISVLWFESLWPAIFAHTFYDMTVYYIFYGDEAIDETGEARAPARQRLLRLVAPFR